jgi:hypothetical protein
MKPRRRSERRREDRRPVGAVRATGFAAYFQMVPDYRIDVAHTLGKAVKAQ